MQPSSRFVALLLLAAQTGRAQEARLPLADLRDRIRGAWTGKMVGVAVGFPTEFKWQGKVVPVDKLPKWSPEMLRESLRQDDLYIQMTFAQVMDERGIYATTEDYAAMFRDSKYPLWHANLAGRRALRRGAPPREAGSPHYNAHGNDISFQIDADFIGLMCPGMPATAAKLIPRPAQLIARDNGIYGGQFIAGMYASAFFESDPRLIVEAGLACVPPESTYAHAIRDVLESYVAHPDDWEHSWRLIGERWDHDDLCPQGACGPLDINASLNGAYVALGMLYGQGDFWKTIEIATRCGQDSDCNPSTAAGIWGASHGFAKIPPEYASYLPQMNGEKFTHTVYSFDEIVESTYQRAIKLAKNNGGRLEGDELIIHREQPSPQPQPAFPPIGKPVERISCQDPRWTWRGAWTDAHSAKTGAEKVTSEKNAEAEVAFHGSGAILVGPYLGNGGLADVYIDGKLDRTVDVYPDESRRRAGEAVWHNYYLGAGDHKLRVVVRGEKYPESSGSEIRITDLITLQ